MMRCKTLLPIRDVLAISSSRKAFYIAREEVHLAMSQQSGLQREPLLDRLRSELEGLDNGDLLWRISTLQSPSSPRAKLDGKNVLVLCANNYLGFANHLNLRHAAIA